MKARVVPDMSEAEYHAHPALSSTGARKLLPPGCPALFKYERDHVKWSKAFDFGKAAHAKVLGTGAEIVVCHFKDWRTKAAQTQQQAAIAEGKVPLLPAEAARVNAMAEEIKRHPLGVLLFAAGVPEQSIFWTDQAHGVRRRARLDWFPDFKPDGRCIIPDYKTAASANLHKIRKSIYEFGYHCQGAWYVDAAIAAGQAGPDAAFLLIVQEKTPPYLVTVVQIHPEAIKLGRQRNALAMEIFADCEESGIWPGYTPSTEVSIVDVPNWAYREDDE